MNECKSGLWKHGLLLTLLFGFTVMILGGVLGFLINLPIVSYFQHRSFLPAAHGHGALMGVYGMLAIALALFGLRNIVDTRYWKERWLMTGFSGLNVGLLGMIVITLVPVGVMQAVESFENGFWSARSLQFYQRPVVKMLLWWRMVPDTVFIVVGVLPIVAAAAYGLLHLRAVRQPAAVETAGTEAETARELVGA